MDNETNETKTNEQTEKKETELFIKDQNLVLKNIDFTTCLTHISNLNLNGLIEMDYETFKDKFLVKELDNKYVYSENQKIKYDKDLIDLSILAVQNFLHNEKKTQLKFFSLNNIKVFINPNEPMPIVFVFNTEPSYYNGSYDFALVVAPVIESD